MWIILTQGYWQALVTESDQDKTHFTLWFFSIQSNAIWPPRCPSNLSKDDRLLHGPNLFSAAYLDDLVQGRSILNNCALYCYV